MTLIQENSVPYFHSFDHLKTYLIKGIKQLLPVELSTLIVEYMWPGEQIKALPDLKKAQKILKFLKSNTNIFKDLIEKQDLFKTLTVIYGLDEQPALKLNRTPSSWALLQIEGSEVKSFVIRILRNGNISYLEWNANCLQCAEYGALGEPKGNFQFLQWGQMQKMLKQSAATSQLAPLLLTN